MDSYVVRHLVYFQNIYFFSSTSSFPWENGLFFNYISCMDFVACICFYMFDFRKTKVVSHILLRNVLLEV